MYPCKTPSPYIRVRVSVFVCVKSSLLRFHVDGEGGRRRGGRRTEEAAVDEWMNLKTVVREAHPRNRELAFGGTRVSKDSSSSWTLCAFRDCELLSRVSRISCVLWFFAFYLVLPIYKYFVEFAFFFDFACRFLSFSILHRSFSPIFWSLRPFCDRDWVFLKAKW